jgi:hypothetical protein
MWRMWLAIGVTVLIAASVVVGWAAKLTVNGGTLQAFTYPVDLGPVAATVDIDPDTLNPGSEGSFVMAYIELPEGYDVGDIDISTVTLKVAGVDGSVAAAPSPTEVGDHDADGIADLMVKFDRAAVLGLIDGEGGDMTFVVAGGLVDGQAFEGADTVTLTGELGPAVLAAAGDSACTGPLGPCTDYEVQPGDTLWDIAMRSGTTVEALVELNGLEDPRVIFYGSTLNVPYVGEDGGSARPGLTP